MSSLFSLQTFICHILLQTLLMDVGH